METAQSAAEKAEKPTSATAEEIKAEAEEVKTAAATSESDNVSAQVSPAPTASSHFPLVG
jgi:hypothetical protein